jgi:murein DD-endopeptidase MepM/ murein hydrolase activator NlpD
VVFLTRHLHGLVERRARPAELGRAEARDVVRAGVRRVRGVALLGAARGKEQHEAGEAHHVSTVAQDWIHAQATPDHLTGHFPAPWPCEAPRPPRGSAPTEPLPPPPRYLAHVSLSRRLFLAELAASVGPLTAFSAHLTGRGPDIFDVPGDGAEDGFSDYARHRVIGMAAGMDFAIPADPRVFPVASAIVAQVGEDRVSGRFLFLDHGFYQTRYAHLAEVWAHVGRRVDRHVPLGVAGATGLGAAIGPHLHLDLHADHLLANYVETAPSTAPLVWMDPVSFAAGPAVDTNGNATLPWAPADAGALDRAHRAAWKAACAALAPHLAALGPGDPDDMGPAAVAFPEGAPGRARALRRGIRRLHAAVLCGAAGPDAREALVGLLAVRPALTAPFVG